MCVFLCATTTSRQWFDIPAARAYRQALQASVVCDSSVSAHAANIHEPPSRTIGEPQLDHVAVLRVTKRTAWIQSWCAYRAYLAGHNRRRLKGGTSARDWPKAFEAIAKTWGRLLSLVGLRW
jgi:hypothetical protein